MFIKSWGFYVSFSYGKREYTRSFDCWALTTTRTESTITSVRKKHNICAFFGTNVADENIIGDVIAFLRRSRVHYAVSSNPTVYFSIVRQFWNSARYAEAENHIVVDINGKSIIITRGVIKRVLQLGDTIDNPCEFDWVLIRGLFNCVFYSGELDRSMYNEAYLCQTYKYLLHVLIHCLGGLMGGFDECLIMLQSAFVALTLNKPFNFSTMIFYHLKENCLVVNRRKKLLMYPWFIHLVDQDEDHNLLSVLQIFDKKYTTVLPSKSELS